MRHIGLSFEQWASTALLRLAAPLMRLAAGGVGEVVPGRAYSAAGLRAVLSYHRPQAFERLGGGFWADFGRILKIG